jgi:hypothetical protein
MKTGVAGLLVSAVVFAGSSLYLWQQLREQRAISAEVAAANEALKTRLADVERSRDNWNRLSRTDSQSPGELPTAGVPGGSTVADPQPGGPPRSAGVFRANFREPTPAMQKMMRSQMRANHKRLYGDFVAQAGFTRDDANRFYDLLTDQFPGFGRYGDLDESSRQQRMQQDQRKAENALNEFLGPQHAQAYLDYQQTLAARHEVDGLARQMDGADQAISVDQRKRLVAAFAEEQKRVPQPDYSSYGDQELYAKALTEWQNEYNDRVASRARGILDSDQREAFEEYQQWQTEMRAQWGSPQRLPTGVAPMRGAVMMSSGTAISFASPVGETVALDPEGKK